MTLLAYKVTHYEDRSEIQFSAREDGPELDDADELVDSDEPTPEPVVRRQEIFCGPKCAERFNEERKRRRDR